MTKPNSCELVFVIDRSGSMTTIRNDMEGGFKTLIEDQRKVPGSCAVTLVQFDDQYEVVYTARAIDSVAPMSLEPRGSTALFDAIGRTINATGARLGTLAEHDRPSKVIFVVITDGQENASREYNHARVTEMIKHQRDKYAWDFVFLGADENAIGVATSMGINNAAQFMANAAGSAALYSSVSKSVANARNSGDILAYSQDSYNTALEDVEK